MLLRVYPDTRRLKKHRRRAAGEVGNGKIAEDRSASGIPGVEARILSGCIIDGSHNIAVKMLKPETEHYTNVAELIPRKLGLLKFPDYGIFQIRRSARR